VIHLEPYDVRYHGKQSDAPRHEAIQGFYVYQGNTEECRPQHAKLESWSLVEEKMAESSHTLSRYQNCHLVKLGRGVNEAYSFKLLAVTTFASLSLVLHPVFVLLDLIPVSFLGLPKGTHFVSAISGYLMTGHSCIEIQVGRIVLTKLPFDRDTLGSSLVELSRRVKRQVAYIINSTSSSLFDLGSGYMRIIFKDPVR
jgi:hypothetical protein